MSNETRREQGRRIRTEVLGETHVARSLEEADEFTLPMQELVMDYAWAEIWARPGLDRRSRSVLNLGLLAALGHHHELAVHVRGGSQRAQRNRNPGGAHADRRVLRHAGRFGSVPGRRCRAGAVARGVGPRHALKTVALGRSSSAHLDPQYRPGTVLAEIPTDGDGG